MNTIKLAPLYFLVGLLCLPSISSARSVFFADIWWDVRSGSGGPGNGCWNESESSVWVDNNGYLHLKIRQVDGQWCQAEVTSQTYARYGSHRFQVISRLDLLDPSVVLGMFPYKETVSPSLGCPYNPNTGTYVCEIDFEFTDSFYDGSETGVFIVQPSSSPDCTNPSTGSTTCAFDFSMNGTYSSHAFNWLATGITFQSWHGHASAPSNDTLIQEWTLPATVATIPPESADARMHINLWICSASWCRGDKTVTSEQEVIIRNYFGSQDAMHHTLQVHLSGSGSGTVASSPSGIDCGLACTEDFESGTNVNLSATPDPDSTFTGWSGDSDCSDGEVLMIAPHNCTANFAPSCSPPPTPDIAAPSSETSGEDYLVSWSTTSPDGTYQLQEATNPSFSGATTFDLSQSYAIFNHTVTADTTYYYRVRATDSCGGTTYYSSWSSSDTTTLLYCSNPTAPSISAPTTVSSGTPYSVSWSDTSPDDTYQIQEATDPSFSGASTYDVSATSRAFSHSPTDDTTYYYRARATDNCGGSTYSSAWSSSDSTTVVSCSDPPAPSLSAPANAISGSDYTVSWSDTSPDNTYQLQEATDPSFAGATTVGVSGTSKILNHTVAADTTYHYRVRATDECGGSTHDSPWSTAYSTLVSIADANCDARTLRDTDLPVLATYGACRILQAGPSLVVKATAAVTLEAGSHVVLADGFIVEQGGTLIVRTCGHSLCTLGDPLPQGCHSCVGVICDQEAHCCNSSWDAQCVEQVATTCGLTCPTVSVTEVFTSVQDAGLRGASFANRNYGGDPSGAAEQKAFGAGNDDNYYLDPGDAPLRGALEFDLSSIPSGSTVESATLILKFSGSVGSQSLPLDMFFIPYKDAWNEATITWNTRPEAEVGSQVQGSFPLSGFNPTQNNLAPLVQEWVDGTIPNYGFEVSIPDWETATNKAKYFYQKEWSSSYAAELHVTYTEP